MTLQEELNTLKEKSEGRIPPESRAVMHRATEDLRNSGLMEKVLKVGDTAPEFNLKNGEGTFVSSRELLDKGPLVLTFYRGKW